MSSNTLSVSILGIALVTGMAVASPDEYERHEYYAQRGPMPFELVDLDKDGVVTAEEYTQVRSERQAYRSGQGYPMRHAGSAPRFQQIDRDADGSISEQEFAQHQAVRMNNRHMGWRRFE